MAKKLSIVTLFMCAFVFFMAHSVMPHTHNHHTSHKHDHHQHDKNSDNKHKHNDRNPEFDHSEAFGVAIIKSYVTLTTKSYKQAPHTDFLQPSQAVEILVFKHPPDRVNSYFPPQLCSNTFKAPKSLRAPPFGFLL